MTKLRVTLTTIRQIIVKQVSVLHCCLNYNGRVA